MEWNTTMLGMAAWLGLGAVALTSLVGLTLVGLSMLTAHSVILLGHRVSDADAADEYSVGELFWYRFAIQNAEDVALDSDALGVERFELRIEIDSPGGRFLTKQQVDAERAAARGIEEGGRVGGAESVEPKFFEGRSNPTLYAGPHPVPVERDPKQPSTYRVQFCELPAYDTWVVEFTTDSDALSVSLNIDEIDADGDRVQRSLARIHPTSLRLSRSETMALKGNLRSPRVVFGVTSIAIMCAIYLCISWVQSSLPWIWAAPFDVRFDLPAAGLLAVVGAVMFVLSRRPAPMIAQGYLEETRGSTSPGESEVDGGGEASAPGSIAGS